MKMVTCKDGLELMEYGNSFYAWDRGALNDEIEEFDIEVPEGAYTVGEVVNDDGEYVTEYHVFEPQSVKII